MASTIEVQQAPRKIREKSISTTVTGAAQFLPFYVPDIGDDEIQGRLHPGLGHCHKITNLVGLWKILFYSR